LAGLSTEPKTLVHFTADAWEHVCPVLRVRSPAQLAGWTWIQGNGWMEGGLQVYPDRIAAADLVLIQRDFPRYAEAYSQVLAEARLQGKPVVYEIDDLLTELPSTHPDERYYRSMRAPILAALIQADAVTCATPELGDYVRRFNPRAFVLPNYLDDRLWQLRELEMAGGRPESPLVIGYLGAPSHRPDLEFIVPALLRLLDRFRGRILLRLWGIPLPPGLSGRADVEWLDLGLVSYADFAAYFSRQQADIFIAPLLDNAFNRCKSSLKFLEYSALGVPGVYSQLAPYERVVRDGENGFLAATCDQWEQSLARLIDDQALRLKLGRAAQATVREGWLLSAHARDWDKTVSELAGLPVEVPVRERERQAAEKFRLWHQDGQAEARILQRRLEEKEKDIQALAAQSENYRDQYLEMQRSSGWKLVERLYRVRLRLAPRGSAAENFLHAGLHSLRVMKNEGAGALLRRWGSAVKHRRLEPVLAGSLPQPLPPEVRPGDPLPSPAISVVIERNVLLPEVDEEAVLRWVRGQSLDAVELIVWDRAAGRAFCAQNPRRSWAAPQVGSLCQGLNGRYLCLASSDLINQNSTYLEANLMALEGEGLVFTLNQLGRSGWTTRKLHLGRLPGDRLRPLLRTIVRKEYVRDDYAIDLADRVASTGGMSSKVGKVLTHTSAQPELGESFPVETPFGEVDARTEGFLIQARLRSTEPWQSSARLFWSLDSALPAGRRPSDPPTVALVMPFLAVGGAEQQALKVMQQLMGRVRFLVFCYEDMDPALGTLVDAFRQVTPYVYMFPDFLDSALFQSAFNHLQERFEIDTLYIANGTPWIYDALEEIKRRNPEMRIVNQVYHHEIGWIYRYDPALVLYIDRHIASNTRIQQAYQEKGVRSEQIFYIENGIEPAELDPSLYSPDRIAAIKAKLGLPLGSKVVSFASRIHPQKRPMDFVELARRMQASQDLAFLMVGDGPLAAQVDEQAGRIGLKNFHRRPFYRPISDILAISDVLVLPSDFEGMPNIILEAQAMGKPMVVTDVGNNREVFERTGGGVVISQIGDVGALMQGVQAMLADPPDPEQIRQVVLADFRIDVIAQKYYEALVEERHA
jgi:glycosyltransferase involved in cell wall biosynthesis